MRLNEITDDQCCECDCQHLFTNRRSGDETKPCGWCCSVILFFVLWHVCRRGGTRNEYTNAKTLSMLRADPGAGPNAKSIAASTIFGQKKKKMSWATNRWMLDDELIECNLLEKDISIRNIWNVIQAKLTNEFIDHLLWSLAKMHLECHVWLSCVQLQLETGINQTRLVRIVAGPVWHWTND